MACNFESEDCITCNGLESLKSSLITNIALLAETGYSEGQMCHILMRGTTSEKKDVVISTPMLVK